MWKLGAIDIDTETTSARLMIGGYEGWNMS